MMKWMHKQCASYFTGTTNIHLPNCMKYLWDLSQLLKVVSYTHFRVSNASNNLIFIQVQPRRYKSKQISEVKREKYYKELCTRKVKLGCQHCLLLTKCVSLLTSSFLSMFAESVNMQIKYLCLYSSNVHAFNISICALKFDVCEIFCKHFIC